jgi:hypothetical protein
MVNLVLLCSHHHHLLHRGGWSWDLEPDGTFHVTCPDGHTQTTRPTHLVAEPVRSLFEDDAGPPGEQILVS